MNSNRLYSGSGSNKDVSVWIPACLPDLKVVRADDPFGRVRAGAGMTEGVGVTGEILVKPRRDPFPD